VIGDLNGDGLLDIVVNRNSAGPGLYLNRSDGTGHWLRLRLQGSRSNRDGYGARVTVTAGGRVRVRESHAACSYQSSCEPLVHIGLGSAAAVDELRVRWPSGLEETFPVPGIDRVLILVEGEGKGAQQKNALRRGGPAKGGAPTGSGGWDQSVVLSSLPGKGSDETYSRTSKSGASGDAVN
jgi:hypothetical protein